MLSETSSRLRLSCVLLQEYVARSIFTPKQTKVNTLRLEAAVNLAELSFNLWICQVGYDVRTASTEQVDDVCNVILHFVHIVLCHHSCVARVRGKKVRRTSVRETAPGDNTASSPVSYVLWWGEAAIPLSLVA